MGAEAEEGHQSEAVEVFLLLEYPGTLTNACTFLID